MKLILTVFLLYQKKSLLKIVLKFYNSCYSMSDETIVTNFYTLFS